MWHLYMMISTGVNVIRACTALPSISYRFGPHPLHKTAGSMSRRVWMVSFSFIPNSAMA